MRQDSLCEPLISENKQKHFKIGCVFHFISYPNQFQGFAQIGLLSLFDSEFARVLGDIRLDSLFQWKR